MSFFKMFSLVMSFLLLHGINSKEVSKRELSSDDAPKVDVKLYFEAMCGGCGAFIHQQLRALWADSQLQAITTVSVFPAGNGKCTKEGEDYKCECQHGPQECLSNQLMDCVISKHPNPVQYLPFVFCFDLHDIQDSGAKCLRANHLPDSLLQCAQSSEGRKLQAEMYAKTPAEHQYVPWVVLNGKHSTSAENDLKAAVCEAYTGAKPSSCNKTARKQYKKVSVCKQSKVNEVL